MVEVLEKLAAEWGTMRSSTATVLFQNKTTESAV